jgi:hypothetical protein
MGGDTKYNAMVTEMYIKLGGEEGTGMDIDSFAKEYFKNLIKVVELITMKVLQTLEK